MRIPLEISPPAMRIIVGWTRFQSGRRVIRTLVCCRATHLHDYNRKKKEQFKKFEVHIQIKETGARVQAVAPSHFYEPTHTQHKGDNRSHKKDGKADEENVFTCRRYDGDHRRKSG